MIGKSKALEVPIWTGARLGSNSTVQLPLATTILNSGPPSVTDAGSSLNPTGKPAGTSGMVTRSTFGRFAPRLNGWRRLGFAVGSLMLSLAGVAGLASLSAIATAVPAPLVPVGRSFQVPLRNRYSTI